MCQVFRVLYIYNLYTHMFSIFDLFKPLIYKQYKGIHVLIMCQHCAGQKVREKGEKEIFILPRYCQVLSRYYLGITMYLLGST